MSVPFIFSRERKLQPQEALMIAQILGVNVEGMASLSLHIDESLNMVAYGRGDSPDGNLPVFAAPNNWHPNWGETIREMQEAMPAAPDTPAVIVDAPLPEIESGALDEGDEREIAAEIIINDAAMLMVKTSGQADKLADGGTLSNFIGIEELAVMAGVKTGIAEDVAKETLRRALIGGVALLDTLGVSVKKVRDEHARLVDEGYRYHPGLYTAIYQALEEVTKD